MITLNKKASKTRTQLFEFFCYFYQNYFLFKFKSNISVILPNACLHIVKNISLSKCFVNIFSLHFLFKIITKTITILISISTWNYSPSAYNSGIWSKKRKIIFYLVFEKGTLKKKGWEDDEYRCEKSEINALDFKKKV